MAKRKKTAARAGEEKKPPSKATPWKPLEPKVEEGDCDSDAGSFMKDNTEDFLPAKWAGNSKAEDKKQQALPEINTEGTTQIDVATTTSLIAISTRLSPQAPEFVPGPKLFTFEAITTSVSETVEKTAENISTSAYSHDESSIKDQDTTNDDIGRGDVDDTIGSFIAEDNLPTKIESIQISETRKVGMVLISRLQVPSGMIRKPKTKMEELQEQIKSLKHAAEKKDRDVKAAKNEATQAKAQLAVADSRREEALHTLKVELDMRFAEQRQELEEVEAEHQKATMDLRKARAVSGQLNHEKGEALRSLGIQSRESKRLASIMNSMAAEKLKQDRIIANYQKTSRDHVLARQRFLLKSCDQEVELESLCSQYALLQDRAAREIDNLKKQLAIKSGALVVTAQATSNHRYSDEDYWRMHRKYIDMLAQYNSEKKSHSACNVNLQNVSTGNLLMQKENCQLKRTVATKDEKLRTQDTLIGEYQTEVFALKQERDLKAPLVDVGAKVRLRYLEHAREIALNTPYSQIDRAIIMNGNIAAHRASGATDAPLFKLDLVPEEHKDEANKIYKELYQVTPDEYLNWGPNTRKLVDCNATLKSLKPGKGIGRAIGKRAEHSEFYVQLVELHGSFTGAVFEVDHEVREKIEALADLTDEIVETERSKPRRRRRYVSEVRWWVGWSGYQLTGK